MAGPRLDLLTGSGVIGLSLLLSAATRHLLETPLQRRGLSTRAGYRVAGLATAAVLLVAAGWQVATVLHADTGTLGDPLHPGAAVLAGDPSTA